MSPIEPTFREALLSFGPLALLFLAAALIVWHWVRSGLRRWRPPEERHGPTRKTSAPAPPEVGDAPR